MSHHQPDNRTSLSFLDIVWRYKYYLAFYIVSISFLSFTVLYLIGGVPAELKLLSPSPEPRALATATSTSTPVDDTKAETSQPDYPLRVIIDKIGIDTPVSNPISTDLTVLNNDLLKGAVRYPGSGTLGHGNMFIFGHSTGIRVVNNQAYKAFNHLKDLAIGDIVRIQSAGTEYNYKVTSVSLVDSNQALVSFSDDKDMVTLSTCNVFGEKQERYVVEATYIKSVALE
jgi:LPXTG-site transpeptidase (sortase) family protein